MFVKNFNLIIVLCLFLGCNETKKIDPYVWIPLEVTATAYNSFGYQTSGDPNITAWGDTLVPGMKSIAVSRDLIAKGLKHGTMVRIDTFPDTFYINDKMHRRWKNRIDIYMGKDNERAREWGRKKVKIEFAVLRESVDSLTISEIKEK
jgi:3D (Asp-Asp-Asp) domain-containing protein